MTNLDKLKLQAYIRYEQAKTRFFIIQLLSYLAYSALVIIKIMGLISIKNMYLIAFVDILIIAIFFALMQKTYTDINKVFVDWTNYLTDDERKQMGLGGDCICDGQVK